MSERNPQTSKKSVQAIASAARVATVTPSTGVDTKGFAELEVECNVGTVVGAGSGTLALQESSASDGSGDAFAPWTGSTFTAFTTSNHQKMVLGRVRLEGRKRYIRAVLTYSGNGTTEVVPVGVVFDLRWPEDTTLTADTYNVDTV